MICLWWELIGSKSWMVESILQKINNNNKKGTNEEEAFI